MSEELFQGRPTLTRGICLLPLGDGLSALQFNFRILLYIMNVNKISVCIVTKLKDKLFLVCWS